MGSRKRGGRAVGALLVLLGVVLLGVAGWVFFVTEGARESAAAPEFPPLYETYVDQVVERFFYDPPPNTPRKPADLIRAVRKSVWVVGGIGILFLAAGAWSVLRGRGEDQ